jgi:hypothetical protein
MVELFLPMEGDVPLHIMPDEIHEEDLLGSLAPSSKNGIEEIQPIQPE